MLEQFIGYTCWQEERVGQVINREAVEMDAATFLATHLPMSGLNYETAEHAITDKTENGLLQELLKRARQDKHTFVVLQGIPGTGKSHLVRWLKERYARVCAEEGLDEVPLLIRRANSSLRETLKQLIQSDVFEGSRFESYLRRLEDATIKLSSRELSNRLLNALQEAALAVREGTYEPGEKRYSKRITKDMPDFLLSIPGREYLQRPDGGLQYIVQFLSGDERSSGAGEEMPQFEEADFDFPPDVLRELKHSDGPTRQIAEYNTSQRDNLVSYMNALLNRAVSNLTSITPEQLKGMFGELRRQLRRQNQNLALFIEDITAFTGLDAGLIDVLIDQHGADNPEFCRLTSLIGITDNYYEEQFREHVRERITFRISLNTGDVTNQSSSLLETGNNVAELAARYLNAIRLPDKRISDWHERPADPGPLPNACEECHARTICHEHFGTIKLNDDPESAVGLYPFNEMALNKLYNNINPQRTTRTPRALLNNILSYILSSHTELIRTGRFPPAPNELAPDVTPPNLRKPAQRAIIDRATNNQKVLSDRVETLLRFWGDGTVDSPDVETVEIVGTLTRVVFDVFELPFVKGDTVTSIPTTPNIELPQAVTTVPMPTESVPERSPNSDDIEQWRTGGRLQNYQRLASSLAKFVKASISWELHGISQTLVDERVTQARFEIEGQAGSARLHPRYTFPRNDEMALVLHALDNLEHIKEPAPDQLSTDLTALHSWLAVIEEDLIEYVRSIGAENGEVVSLSYEMVVTEAVYALDALSGQLSKQQSEPLLQELVVFAKEPPAFPSGDENRANLWSQLLKSLLGNKSTPVLTEFLTVLNCPQGSTKEVRFIDAARGLDLLKQINHTRQFTNIVLPQTKSSAWNDTVSVHNKLNGEAGIRIHQEEFENLQRLQSALRLFLAGETVSDVIDALKRFYKRADELKYSMDPVPTFPINQIAGFVQTDLPPFDASLPLDQWRYLAEIAGAKHQARLFHAYLQSELDKIETSIERLERELETSGDDDITQRQRQIESIVQKISDSIDDLLK